MRVIIATYAAVILAGCTTTPEQVGRVIDLAESVATNLNAGAAGAGMPVESGAGTPTPQPPSLAPSNAGAAGVTTPVEVINNPPPSLAPINRQLRWDTFPRVSFNAPEIKSWPTKIVKQLVCGTLCANGEKIEWIGEGRMWASYHNATVPGKYHKGFKSGQVIRVSLKDINGKNEIYLGELVWP